FAVFALILAAQESQAIAHHNAAPGSQAANPVIGANFLGLYLRGPKLPQDSKQVPHNGFSLQESEFSFSSDVDPYFKASAVFSVAQENGQSEFSISPEEVYFETLSLPWVNLRVGKFKAAFGKQNSLHTHAYPFIDSPLINQQLFGAEGLNEVGASAAVLIPASWFIEIIAQTFTTRNEALFNSPNSGDLGGLLHLKNLWDLNDDITFEAGLSGVLGTNSADQTASVCGADLTLKWRPASGGKYKAVSFTTEFLYGKRKEIKDSDSGLSAEKITGLASWLQYQFAERWWAQGRVEKAYGISQFPGSANDFKVSTLLGFFPSEFSGLRMQYDFHNLASNTTDHTLGLQYIISIGAHPAHAY
ncbi:MAG: hypothetical protein AABZ55_03575, partial [Bdellovibrionota bacterium]